MVVQGHHFLWYKSRFGTTYFYNWFLAFAETQENYQKSLDQKKYRSIDTRIYNSYLRFSIQTFGHIIGRFYFRRTHYFICSHHRRFSCGYWTFFARKRSEEHTSELQSRGHLVCRLL